MPHMMPMMWTLTLISSMIILYFTLSMIYFLFIPYPYSLMNSLTLKNHMKIKWIWKW
uniref:ATP synthase F0 subunit 8 n=1 Tax=Formica candida TaxID=299549 RepID=UPI0022F2FC5D|nr:ATP synthase F0 subunit 8 [Formica candida]WAK85238.1 ATP synthase F0 subunit 8 [Formica candida]WLN31346.1 ATP synthase F0 subunit 8 [Formica candida]